MNRPLGRRVEKLEQAFGVGVAQEEPIVIEVKYVAPGGEVVGGYVVEVGKPNTPLPSSSKVSRCT